MVQPSASISDFLSPALKTKLEPFRLRLNVYRKVRSLKEFTLDEFVLDLLKEMAIDAEKRAYLEQRQKEVTDTANAQVTDDIESYAEALKDAL